MPFIVNYKDICFLYELEIQMHPFETPPQIVCITLKLKIAKVKFQSKINMYLENQYLIDMN